MHRPPTLAEVHSQGIALLVGSAPHANVWFTNREGGVSRGPYASLNVAARVGDHPAAVGENRRRAAAAAGFDVTGLTFSRQVHGKSVLEIGTKPDGPMVAGVADVLVTRRPNVILGILVADCAPVVLAGERGLAVVHAGWRGLVEGVVESGVASVAPVRSAWIGPSIHACCYEVGPAVVAAFRERGLPIADDRHVDPGMSAVAELRRLGVERVVMSDDCTSCDTRYFSYRRDGTTGRQAAFACLSEPQ
ncbi:MAG: polyphenol oxidase family protein [Actinomycetota bacterium]